MEKIRSFYIKKLSMRGFKKFLEPVEFEFGGMTAIMGQNAQGKSSIAEAITYAITGAPYFGGEKSIDRLYTIDTREMRICLTIDAGGTEHELIRERVNDETTITFDTVQIKQSDLNTMFGERDLFLSIFNPLYFSEELGDKGRNLLERCLPAVSYEEIMSRLDNRSRALIESSKIVSPEGLLKQINGKLKELRDSVVYAEGQRDLLAEQEERREESIRDKRAQLDILFNTLTALNEKKAEGLNIGNMKSELTELYARLDGRSRDATIPDTTEIDTEIARLVRALEQRRAEQYQSKYSDTLSGVSAKLEELVKRYRQEKAIHDNLRSGIKCPSCRREITDANLSDVKAAYAESINAVSAEGKEYTAQLKELQELDAKTREIFIQFQAEDVAKLEEQLVAGKASRDALVSGSNSGPDDISGLKTQTQSLESKIKNGNLSIEEAAEFNEKLEQYNSLNREIETLTAQEQHALEKKEQDIAAIRRELSETETLEAAVRLYISERVNLIFGNFDMLNRVGIQLYDIVKKTGEVRDVFKITYDGKPYRYLSYSEKIKAGLEISGLLKTLTNSDYPVFIDNGESIPVIDNIKQDRQVIFSQVVKNKPLTVTSVSVPAQQIAA